MEKKYKIRIECTDAEEQQRFDEELEGGVECDGFVLIAKKGEHKGSAILHDINMIDLACLIAGNDDLMEASIIAKALAEARERKMKSAGNDLHKLLDLLR